MLFCFSGCKRKAYKRRSRIGGACLRVGLALAAAMLAVLLLFIAPHWLLVLLVIMLGAVLAAVIGWRQ